jgi:peptidoglycan/xylan/chitin deacetylase (PgdA/CDA1 family)
MNRLSARGAALALALIAGVGAAAGSGAVAGRWTAPSGQTPTATAAPSVAFTFDDIPAHGPLPPGVSRVDVIRGITDTLKAEKVPAFGFLNAGFGLDDPKGPEAIAVWRRAGFPLGNHTYSHGNLDTIGAEAFAKDTILNEQPLAAAAGAGADWHWFRYPFLSEGSASGPREAIRTMLRARGYKVAAVTMSFGDFLWNPLYAACSVKRDAAAVAKLEASFLADARSNALAARAAAKAKVGRDVPHVLLMHVGAFDAHMLPRLIALYRSLGFRFVTLQEAEADPFYAAATDLTGAGPTPSLNTPSLPGPPAGLCR